MADVFKNTLSRIPTVFGRLMYLASLRDQNSGVYRHHGLSSSFGREESIKALRQSHESVFEEWLGMSLEQKHRDLTAYFQELPDTPAASVIRHWRQSRVYQANVPAHATEAEKQLFSQELELLLEVLNYGASEAPDRASSPHP